MIPPAPGTFSTMTVGLPGSCLPRCREKRRAHVSLPPPATKPTVMVTVLFCQTEESDGSTGTTSTAGVEGALAAGDAAGDAAGEAAGDAAAAAGLAAGAAAGDAAGLASVAAGLDVGEAAGCDGEQALTSAATDMATTAANRTGRENILGFPPELRTQVCLNVGATL